MAQNANAIEYFNKARVEERGKTAEVSIDSSRKPSVPTVIVDSNQIPSKVTSAVTSFVQ